MVTEEASAASGLADGGSGQMFDRIAGRYDRLNRIMSLGMDVRWRRALVAALPPGEVLDVATGTADVALALARRDLDTLVTGLDPSANMLEFGREKVRAARLGERIDLVEGDAQRMPFAADHFAGSCIAFGIRNVPDRALGLAEMTRVTRPGGPVAILELTEPRGGIMAFFARLHVRHVVPRLGAWLSKDKEYRYLQASIAAFPPVDAFVAEMEAAGLRDVEVQRMSFGAVHLFVGRA